MPERVERLTIFAMCIETFPAAARTVRAFAADEIGPPMRRVGRGGN